MFAVERIVLREEAVVFLELGVDGRFDQGFGVGAGEIFHGFLGGFDAAGGHEGAGALQILGGLFEEGFLGALVGEAIGLAVLVGPGGAAVGHHMPALGQRFGALAAELGLRR